MSVFEDLIDELKNENLLEESVIDLARAELAEAVATDADGGHQGDEFRDDPVADEPTSNAKAPTVARPKSDQELFRKRAMEEVSGLQMVEHVFSGIEREHLKITPRPFDDLKAKQALHRFVKVCENPGSGEHAEAEFDLRVETEAWNLALSERDQQFSVSSLRRFCEESQPVLSSSVMIALARFFRNSPYSEEVRGKFDYSMTRLFSTENEDGRRNMLFQHDEMIGHINTLYADWSSIALYTNEEDQPEIALTVTRLDEFVDEAARAGSFGELLGSEFFNRLRGYKEGLAEMFYVPEVLAAAMKCNLAVGNRYVELIALERNNRSAEKVEERYGSEFDNIVSNAAGKTLALTDVLALDIDVSEEYLSKPATQVVSAGPKPSRAAPAPKKANVGRRFNVSGINRWLALFCVIVIVAGAGIYVWSERTTGSSGAEATMAKPVEIDVPDANKYLKNARFTNQTLYAVTRPAFDTLTESEQKEFLGKLQKFAASKDLMSVALLNNEGRTIAFASNTRLELDPK